MSVYIPDRWVVFRAEVDGANIYKILAGWKGGYLDADTWRINSSCASVKRDGDFFEFTGHSGSIYRVHKDAYGTTLLSGSILQMVKEQADAADVVLEVMPWDTDWESVHYE